MWMTIEKLRRGIIVAAVLLVVVLAGFFFYARRQLTRITKDLPGKLGANIQQTANGFTYSQSDGQGHTLFTLRASKLTQFKGGHALLHDVAITLYGPPGSGRVDKIYGSDFDYDQAAGIATAQGQVEIDLEGPAGEGAEKSDGNDGQAQRSTIHVKTSGLSFNQKTGEAETAQHAEFQLPKAAGQAMGASYNSKTGLLVLGSQVEFTTSTDGNAATVHAAHAQMMRSTQQAYLLSPVTDFRNEKSSAKTAVLHFRKDGTTDRIDAEGDVHVATDTGTTMQSQKAVILLDGKSQPTRADMSGGVIFAMKRPGQTMHGVANEGTVNFGSESTITHAQLRNTVSVVEQVNGLRGDPRGSATRELRGSQVDVNFRQEPGNKSLADKVLVRGGAVMTLRSLPTKGAGQDTTLMGDQLLATLGERNTIRQLDGSGQTKIIDKAQDGSVNTSSGDVLKVLFAPAPAERAAGRDAKQAEQGGFNTSQISSAVQVGHVVLTQTPAKKGAAGLHATAQRADYHEADQVLHLTGGARLENGALDLTASAVDYNRESGDAAAKGDVKATYQEKNNGEKNNGQPGGGPQLGGEGPVHIVAAAAEFAHASGISRFTGTEKAPPHMWQGANSITAPVIELSRKDGSLRAHGAKGTMGVRTTLATMLGPKRQADVVRIESGTLDYSDQDRRGDFRGGVKAEDADGTIHSDEAQVYLAAANGTHAQTAKQTHTSQIDHIVAMGHVVLTQPGRKGTGEKLVYTAKDGKYVLTGSPKRQPMIEDAQHGRTTGAALIFNSQDDSVEVSGGQSGAVTDTRVPK